MTTKFDIGDIVFALDHYHNSKVEGIIAESIHLAEVVQISISEENKVEYWLKNYNNNKEWGDSVEEKYVSKDILDLVPYLQKEIEKIKKK